MSATLLEKEVQKYGEALRAALRRVQQAEKNSAALLTSLQKQTKRWGISLKDKLS